MSYVLLTTPVCSTHFTAFIWSAVYGLLHCFRVTMPTPITMNGTQQTWVRIVNTVSKPAKHNHRSCYSQTTGKKAASSVSMQNRVNKKHTTPGIRWWSPTQLPSLLEKLAIYVTSFGHVFPLFPQTPMLANAGTLSLVFASTVLIPAPTPQT